MPRGTCPWAEALALSHPMPVNGLLQIASSEVPQHLHHLSLSHSPHCLPPARKLPPGGQACLPLLLWSDLGSVQYRPGETCGEQPQRFPACFSALSQEGRLGLSCHLFRGTLCCSSDTLMLGFTTNSLHHASCFSRLKKLQLSVNVYM